MQWIREEKNHIYRTWSRVPEKNWIIMIKLNIHSFAAAHMEEMRAHNDLKAKISHRKIDWFAITTGWCCTRTNTVPASFGEHHRRSNWVINIFLMPFNYCFMIDPNVNILFGKFIIHINFYSIFFPGRFLCRWCEGGDGEWEAEIKISIRAVGLWGREKWTMTTSEDEQS